MLAPDAKAAWEQFHNAIERELPTHFDLVVNTDVVTPERAADVIVAAVGEP